MADTAAIASEIQRMHSEFYGHTPDEVRVYEAGELLIVLIEDAFSRAEQILIGRGEADEVQIIRRRFEQVIADRFKDVIERATGRCVRAFLSDTDLVERLAVETFVLGDAAEDMSTFERAGERVDTQQEITDQSRREAAFELREEGQPPRHG
jgi:uncharacterized protein YbcI